jgi:2-oxoglutarate ferredoxin oxidoreductase subunit beta
MTQTFPLNELKPLTRKDFITDQEVRWCPGCGDYSILAQTQKVLPELGVPKENIVFISGIGCSSRLPYYVETYGFHSIHGRALTLATGLKASRPELQVWVITGDGDGLSIGGNHLLHAMRRNVDLNVILFNNRIYGLTKGQYSPTSEFGKITKSSPFGTIDRPLDPIRVALAAEATFVARSMDVDTAHLQAMLKRAAEHQGISFLEVYQNCNIFNDGAFKGFTDREVRDDRVLYLEHGKPMRFGKERQHGLRLNGFEVEIVENAADDEGLLVHDEAADPALANILARLTYPDYPVPVGVFRDVQRPTLEYLMAEQVEKATAKGKGDLGQLLHAGETWVVD